METRHQESFQQMETMNQANFQQREAKYQTNFTELKITLEKSMAKAESSKRWAIGLVITVALAFIGFILTEGFQFQF